MYRLCAKNRKTTKWDELGVFYDERQFHYMCDTVDKEKYSGVMITDESCKHCLFHYDFPDYTPYFEKYGKVRVKKNNGQRTKDKE